MTKAPERIKLRNAGCHETEGKQIWTNVGMGYNKVEYIRADLHAELMRAADEVARLLNDEANCYAEFDNGRIEMKKALTAYQQAKEKVNG